MISQNDMKQKKQVMIDTLNKKGPSLPSAISKEINLSLLFTSALFSELVAEKTVKFSNLKIGGSPLYYLEGQENQLDNFVNYLPAKEKEAFELLKDKSILNSEELNPSIRVALFNIKDFAVPMKIKFNNEEKIFWRLHTVLENDALKKIEQLENKKEIEKEPVKEIELLKEDDVKEIYEKPRKKYEKRKRDVKEDFREKACLWLDSKGFEFIEKFDKKESIGIVSVNSDVGNLNFAVVAKNKSKLNESDLSLAYQEGLHLRMPVLLLIKGELTKKALEYLNTLGKYLVVKKIVK